MASPIRILYAAILFAALGVASSAQAEYPQRPITVIVPYRAGGAGDAVLRILSRSMEAALGQTLILVSRPGASGNLGAQSVVNAAPDGYTLLLGATGNFVINQFLFPDMKFDPLTALVPITIVAKVPAVFYTNPSVPARNLAEFIAYARANPGKLNYGSPGIGTTPHLAVEQLARIAGLDMVHVPFQGAAHGVQALLRNDIQLYVGGVVLAKGEVEAGKLRALAVSSPHRLAALPDVPTLQESGIKNFDPSNWWMLAAPKDTDQAVVARLYDAVVKALANKQIQERFEQMGLVPGGQPPSEVASRIPAEAKVWRDVIVKARVSITQ